MMSEFLKQCDVLEFDLEHPDISVSPRATFVIQVGR